MKGETNIKISKLDHIICQNDFDPISEVYSFLKINFSQIKKFPDIDDKWSFVKDKVIEAIELCCPLKKFKNKDKDFSSRSHLAFDYCPENIQFGEISARLVPYQVELFNNFFTNVESSSFSTEDESLKYIFEKFKEFKKKNNFKTPRFTWLYRHSHERFKAMPEIFSPILLKLFNSCLELKKIPEYWKIATVTPLYKNKDDKTKMDNYRAIS
ncbi:unnamed protein product, partial [Brachionus calyciflorus]